jgi:hypothetical protein
VSEVREACRLGGETGRQAGYEAHSAVVDVKLLFSSGQAARGPQLNVNGLNLEIGTANESRIPV